MEYKSYVYFVSYTCLENGKTVSSTDSVFLDEPITTYQHVIVANKQLEEEYSHQKNVEIHNYIFLREQIDC